jgi:thioredoxin 1
MSDSTVKHWRPIVTLSALSLAGVVVLTGLSTGSFLNGASPTGRFVPTRTEGEVMSTIQASRKIEHVHANNFNEKVLQSEVPVLVDFYADWCRPCRALTPVLEELARETPNARIVKVNVDENPELAARYRIESIPNLLIFRESRLTGQHAGLANKAFLRRLLMQ